MNAISWILALAGAVAFLASAAAFIYILVQPRSLVVDSQTALHDTYYVVTQSKLQAWPFLLVMALSAAIAIVGYCRTDQFVRRMLQSSVHATPET